MPRNTQQILRTVVVHVVEHTQMMDGENIVEEITAVDNRRSEYKIRFIPVHREPLYTREPIELQFLEGNRMKLMCAGIVVSDQVTQVDITNPLEGWPYVPRPEFEREYLSMYNGSTISLSKKQKYPEMTCAFCDDKIHNPEHLRELLGPQQTKKYLEFCKKIDAKPTLYCCKCFKVIKENPKFFKAFNDMIKQYKMWKKGFDKMMEAGK